MAGPQRLGEYEIEEEIGRGGFGVVYLARQTSLDRPVALKVLYRNLIHTQDQITRFEREARAAAKLDHSNIVSVYAWGEDDDDFYIAQQLIGHGRTLADELAGLREGTTVPTGYFRRVADVCAKVARALHHSHDRGIVHRDVKPSNILLDHTEEPFLGDFGLAKVEDGLELSRTGDLAGSPYYLSPEQADSRFGEVSPLSDVYSLGVALYESLTLTQPFSGTSAHEIVRKILSEEPARPSRLQPRVPEELETICLKAMEKDPERRYADAGAMGADLQAFLEGEPIAAQPISSVRRAMRRVRRHRWRIAASLVALVALAVVVWVYRDREKEQEEVKHREDVARVVKENVVETKTDEFDKRIREALAEGDSDQALQLMEEKQETIGLLESTYDGIVQKAGELTDDELVTMVRDELAKATDGDTLDAVGSRLANFARDGAGLGAIVAAFTSDDEELPETGMPEPVETGQPASGGGFFANLFGMNEAPPPAPPTPAPATAADPTAAGRDLDDLELGPGGPPTSPGGTTSWSSYAKRQAAPMEPAGDDSLVLDPVLNRAPWLLGVDLHARSVIVGGQVVLLPLETASGAADTPAGARRDD